jgi:outer membrane receptor protein involved in Fe transport
MQRTRALACASSVALTAALLLHPVAAAAQPTTTTPTQGATADTSTQVEEVVVTGSLIRGTPKTAALPVEVYTNVELEKQGSPTALEFAKQLTIAGPTTGEAYYFGGAPPGSVSYNLRGIGSDKTLTLLNGRRVSQNATNIPQIALARTEVLKDGAAVTYGADAVGGVVNFITRSHFVGLEVSGQYKWINGSDGDWGASVLGGVGEGDVNFIWSAEYQHRSRLNTLKRDFTKDSLDPTVPGYNNAPWSTLTNLAGWLPRGALPSEPAVGGGTTDNNEWGNPTGGVVSDFTLGSAGSCAAVGGRPDNSFTCAYNYISYYNLVETTDIYRGFAQLNAKISDKIDAHVEASYGQVNDPQIFGSPAQPVIRGPALATGLTYQFYVPTTNPYANAFAVAHGLDPNVVQGFTPITYRAFAHGGNPYLGEGNGFGVPSRYESQVFRVSGDLKGQLGDLGFLKEIGWDGALTYNHSQTYADSPDVIGYRLQQALYGFGGPNCNAPDLDPSRFGTQNPALAGVGDCQYWNPFASNFAGQPNLHLANPQHVAGAENSEELTRWLFDPRATRTYGQDLTFDATINGSSALKLWGDPIGWAGGFQARRLESTQFVGSNLYNGNTPCPWPANFTSTNGVGSQALPGFPVATTDPAFRGCTPDSPGPFTFFGTNLPSDLTQNQYSYFGELSIPVYSELNFQLAARHEEFSHGLKTTVYKASGKWHIYGPLSVRGSYGTNFLAPSLGTIPGEVNNGVLSYTIASGNWLGAQYITQSSLKPETAKAWNIGAIWDSRGFLADHHFQLILDYFNIKTQDEIGTIAGQNQIANLIFNGPAVPANVAAGLPAAPGSITNCDATAMPLLNRGTFNQPCFVGMGSVGSFSSISTLVGNGPGQSTDGLDIQATYVMGAGPGDLTLGLVATDVFKLDTGPTSLDGVVVSTGDHRLGTLNFATVASAAPKWRANFSANYALDRHNFRLGVNYVSRVKDERPGIQYGENGETWITTDFTYRFQWRKDLAFTGTVQNLFDKDPPKANEELGYDPRLGNPLGRTFELAVKKTF